MGLMTLWKDMDFVIPLVSGSNTSMTLDSSEEWPNYVRSVVSTTYLVGSYVQILRRLGWTECNIIYSDEPWGASLYASFVKSFAIALIQVVGGREPTQACR